VPRLPVGFSYWDPRAGDEPSTAEDCCIGRLSASEGKEPAAVIALQFATPFFLRPKAANNVAIPTSLARGKIEPVIECQRQL